MSNRQTSVAWSFFEKLPERSDGEKYVKCRKCQVKLRFLGATTLMIQHIDSVHKSEYEKLQNMSKTSRLSVIRDVASLQSDATDNLIMCLSTSNVPFRIVKNQYFKKFIRSLNPHFTLISPDRIRRQLLKTSPTQPPQRVHENELPLPFSCTRWGGCVMLAKSFIEHYECISVLTRFQSFLMRECESEMRLLKEFIEFTSPYLETIHASEADNTFASEAIVQYAGLWEFISMQDQRKLIVRSLCEQTKKRYHGYLRNDISLLALFCDPRFVYLDDLIGFVTWGEVEELAEDYCESYRIVDNSNIQSAEPPKKKEKRKEESFFSKFVQSKSTAESMKSTRSEIIAYKAMIRSSRPSISSCPLQFWISHKHRFFNLCKLARHVLCSPASSAQVERLFSRCGEIVSSTRRNRMLSTTMNDLLLNAALADIKSKNEEKEGDSESEDSETECSEEDSQFIGSEQDTKQLQRSSSVPVFSAF